MLLSYLTLDTRDMRRASIFAHRARMRRIAAQRRIEPHSVASGTDPVITKPVPRRPRPAPEAEDDLNMFANI